MSKTLSFYNLTGGLNTVQDLATINSTPNRTESPDMMNIEYYKLGGIQVMRGNTQIGNHFSNYKVTCGYEYIVGNNSYMIVTTEDNKVYEYNKSTKTFIELGTVAYDESEENISQSATHPRHCMVGYNNGVVISNGYSLAYYNRTLQQKVGNTTRNFFFATKVPKLHPADANASEIEFYPNCIASYKGRLFVGANTTTQDENNFTGSTAFYSGVGLGIKITYSNDNIPEDIDVTWYEAGSQKDEDAGAFAEFFEDSSYFTGLGTWAEYLVIHKEQNTYLLDGTANLSDDWSLKPYSEYTVPSQQSFVVANNGYFTYVPEAGGIYPLLTRTIYNNTLQGTELSFKIKDSFEFLDTERYNEIYATYNPRRKQLLFYMPMIDNLNSNGDFNGSGDCFIFDIQTKTWLRRKVPQNVTCAFKFNNETYIGTNDGKVLQEFKGKTFDGDPVPFYYLTPPFIWGGGTNKTTTKEFRIKMLNSSANHFRVESFKDGNLLSREKRLIKNVNDNLGGLVWDIDCNYGTRVEGSNTKYTDLGDFNPDNFTYDEATQEYTIKVKPSVMYPYTYNGVTYYTPTAITATSWNVPVYNQPDTEPSHFEGYNQALKFYDLGSPVSESDPHNYVQYETTISYAWIQYNPTMLAYKYNDYYAWVKDGVCTTNLIDSTKQELTHQGYNLWKQTNPGSAGSYYYSGHYVRVNTSYNIRVNGLYPIEVSTDGQNWSTLYGGKTAYALTSDNAYGKQCDIVTYLDGVGYINLTSEYIYQDWRWGSGCAESKNDYVNKYTTSTIEKPEGKQPNGKTKTYTSGTNSITINVTGVGNVTLTRYPAEDRGQVEGSILYTKVEEPTTSDKAYTNVDFSDAGTTISAVLDDTITVSGLTYYRYSQADGTTTKAVYYNRIYKLSSDYEGSPIPSTEPIYNYPVLSGDPKSLTDTIWDYSDTDLPPGYDSYDDIPDNLKGDAWLQQGYQTKRLLLPNQYFETIQFKFSGEGDDDSICISGFEVDGIQLAETPWS